MSIALTRVIWPRAVRIISSIFPPIDLFEDTSDPADWDLLVALESKSNPRLNEKIGQLALVPKARRVSGPGASYVMGPFTHISPDWCGRFHDGTFGAYYAASRTETALIETMHHRGNIYRASNEAPGWFSQFRELVGKIDHDFHDVSDRKAHAQYHDPDDYSAPQAFARNLRKAGSDGILYASVRDPKGLCLAAFWPDVIGIPKQARHFAYHFDGTHIDMYRDESTGKVFRAVETA